MIRPGEVVDFWLEAGPEQWYQQSDEFDQRIRDKFGALWETARGGGLQGWMDRADSALALVIVLDQFPRNMFRDDPRAYATDINALVVADRMISEGWDLEIDEPARQFCYMPFMHSEELAHQDLCVELMEARMSGESSALHARVHREIIRTFGRFPYRNDPLERETTAQEQAFLSEGGYGNLLQQLQGAT